MARATLLPSVIAVGSAIQQLEEDPEPQEAQEAQRILELEESEKLLEGLKEAPTWSAKIRYLASEGFKKPSIAYILTELRGYNMSLQHVNNVLQRPLKGQNSHLITGRGRPRQDMDPRAERIVRILPKPIGTPNKRT